MTSKRLLHPIAKHLLDASDYLEKYGHHKGNLFFSGWIHDKQPACVAGAITVAAGLGGGIEDAITYLVKFVGGNVVDWNDHPERTAEEVISTLTAAALAYVPE